MRNYTSNNLTTGTGPPALPRTSRRASQPERSVLAVLRALVPRRALEPGQAEYVAELQANRLLELAGLPEPPIPDELIADLPRILVRRDVDLPASGSTHWDNGRWVISINGSEPQTRQRFSAAHELKHVLDDRFRDVIYQDRPGLSAAQQSELAAEYFAACLLMPKRLVRRAWYDGVQRISELSELFAVSPQAMHRRLRHLGLLADYERCGSNRPARWQRAGGAAA